MIFFNSVKKANAELSAAEEALRPDLEKAGITTAQREGKTIPIADATLAEKYTALRAAQPAGTDLQARAELLESNQVIADRCSKAESDLAISQTSVGTLTREKASLTEQLTTAQSSVATMTAEKADSNNQLNAAINQYQVAKSELNAINTELSRMCVAVGCLELKDKAGNPLAATATPAEKISAAEAVPIAAKLTAYQGAVNTTFAKFNVNLAGLPTTAGATNPPAKVELKGLARMAAATKVQGQPVK